MCRLLRVALDARGLDIQNKGLCGKNCLNLNLISIFRSGILEVIT